MVQRALVAERQAGLDAVHIGLIDHCGFRHVAFLVGVFARHQVSPGSVVANNLAGPGDLEALGHGFARFAACDCFWHWKRGKKLAGEILDAMTIFCFFRDRNVAMTTAAVHRAQPCP